MKTFALACMLSASALAQQPSVEVAGGRRLELLDASRFLTSSAPDLVLKAPSRHDAAADRRSETPPDKDLAGIADFVRRFATPAFAPGDDVQPLGGRYLAVLAAPEKCAAVAAMLTNALEHGDDLLRLDVQLVQVAAEAYTKLVLPLLPADSTPEQRRCLVLSGDTGKLQRALEDGNAEHMSAPTLCVRPLSPASVSVLKNYSYVRDYTVIEKDGRAIADPIVDTAVDGIEVHFVAAPVGTGNVAIDCRVAVHKLQRPILESKVDIGLVVPVIVQMPRVTTVRLAQSCEVPLGASMLLSAQRADGSWLCALVRVGKQD